MSRVVRTVVSGLLEVAGLVFITSGAFVVATWLGFVVGGLAAVVAGVFVDPRAKL